MSERRRKCPFRDEEEDHEPPQKRKKTKKKAKRTKHETEQPQSKEFRLLFKLLNKHTKTIETKLSKLEQEVKKTSEAQKAFSANRDTSRDSTPEYADREISDQRVIYSITNLNQERPKFGGHNYKDKQGKDVHPVTFLEDLTSYLKKIPAQGKELDIVQECLTDQARNWARIYKDRWTDYEDFKRDFLETYWSEVEQNKVRRDIVSNRWDKNKCPTMLSHFLKLAGQINLLTFTIPERQLVSDIMRHYPKNVQQLWALSRNETILAATEFLRQMDNINASEECLTREKSSTMDAPSGARENNDRRRKFNKNYQKYQEWRKPDSQPSTSSKRGSEAGVTKAPGTPISAVLVGADKNKEDGVGNC